MAEHKHGTMNITTQERTFAGFIHFMTWAIIVALVALIFLALANA